MSKVFLVMQVFEDRPSEIQGIFDTRDAAASACHANNFAYLECELNAEYPRETVQADWVFPMVLKDLMA